MFINFWYPIGLSKEITGDKPFRAQVFGLPFVAFRDTAGAAQVISDTCAHRGGALHKGLVKEGTVRCPYHGWAYGGDGRCKLIPSLGVDGKIPARAKVDGYPVQERYGIVFAFLGDLPEAERPPLYDITEFGQPDWKCQTYVIDVAAYYQRSMENGMDPIHNQFVHPLQGAPTLSAELQRGQTPMEDIPWGSKMFMKFAEKAPDSELNKSRTGERTGMAGSWYQGPNQLVTWIELTATNAFHQYIFEQPVDEGHTRLFFLNMRNWLLEDKHDQRVEDLTLRIVHEDIDILENLNPIRTPSSNTKEVLLPNDHAVFRYREHCKEWENKGWRIDMKSMRDKLGDVAFAIPCPARRETGNWVLDAVPLMPAEAAEGAGEARKSARSA
ncbi:MAG: aromatic ring-hydroxylating dioxygenase subunit alpha [Gammaproteobacteria bacterium PRO9]|nr:aromatic ring-hydroxylating dioxygenase subunit alpha [Gammaproteobacteria bacterium PRO9]